MRIVIATDAWRPQVNGVVTTLSKTGDILRQQGHEVLYITPEKFKTFPLPSYSEIRLAIFPGKKIKKLLDEFKPDAVHIATEGTIGLAVRRYCLHNKKPFTTSYHTRFPEYVRMRIPVPLSWSYKFMRWFHDPAVRTMVPTESQRQVLLERGFRHVVIWSRGVDTDIFKPYGVNSEDKDRPIFIYVGRVAVEKNLHAFLNLDLPGKKHVVGDGPDLGKLREQYKDAVFFEYQFGEKLARLIADADVFVFPSKTDTFGLVMLEAMACGVPVAAYPVTGPIDVVKNGETGVLDERLDKAALKALNLDREKAREYALKNSWEAATSVFANNLEFGQAASR